MANENKRRRWPYVLLGIFGLLVAGGWVALSRLDAMLLTKAQEQADLQGEKLGRKIRIGQVLTTLLTGAGVRVASVEVSASAGEEAPLLQLGAAEVKVALWPAITSRGQDIPVRTVEISGLVLNVVRRADGVTNLEDVINKLGGGEEHEPAPSAEPAKPQDLSAVRIDHASLTGEVHFFDKTNPRAKELAIREIDFRLEDLRAGKPLEAVLKAAVLAPAPNLVMKLNTAPLPDSLIPTPERLTVTLKPVDISPLGPFIPASVGLKSGTLEADLLAQLGSAVPGGKGPTRVVGSAHARGLQLASAEGGKAVEIALETDVTGDAEKGDLKLDRLHFALGSAELNGEGEVKGLLTAKPEVKGLVITGKNLDPDKIAPYYPPLRRALRGFSGPLGLSLKGSGNESRQALALALDFTPMRLSIPGQLSKAAGAPMSFDATLSGAPAGGGALRFEAKADLKGADLRPGEQVNKAPGQTLEIATAGSYQPIRGKGGGMKVELATLTVKALGDALSGTAKLELAGSGKTQTTQLAATLKSAHLDADALLLSEPEHAAPTSPSANKGSAKAPAADPHRFDGLKGAIDVQVASLRYQETDFKNVALAIKVSNDQVTLERFGAGVYGGEVSLDGTEVRLAPAERPFNLKVKATGLSMAALLPKSVPTDLVTGRFSGNVALKGSSTDKKTLSKTLTGLIQGDLADGAFRGTDVFSQLAGPLAKALPLQTVGLTEEKVTSLGKNLPFGLEFGNGVARLKKPLQITQPRGSLKVEGGIGLDGTLDLTGILGLSPEAVTAITRGKVTINEPLPIPFRMTGPVTSPLVSPGDLKPAVQMLIRQAAAAGVGKLLGGKLADKLKQEGLGGSPPASPEEAQGEAEEAKRLQQKAKDKLKGLFGGH